MKHFCLNFIISSYANVKKGKIFKIKTFVLSLFCVKKLYEQLKLKQKFHKKQTL